MYTRNMYGDQLSYLQNDFRGRRSDPTPDYGQLPGRRNNAISNSNESLDSTGKTKSFRRLVERFAEKTSMQGVPYINSAKVWYAKLLWTCLLLGCTVGMSLHLYYLISQFILWPVMTKIELGYDNLKFPAVTICNVNPIRQSELIYASDELQDYLRMIDINYYDYEEDQGVETSTTPLVAGKRRRKRFTNEMENLNLSYFYDYEELYEDYYYDSDFEFGGEKDERKETLGVFYSLYSEQERSLKTEIGHLLEDMLISCTIGDRKCFHENFTLLQHELYGNCYTLNTGNLLIKSSGPANGLEMILYMDKENYLPQINEGYGARVVIHDRFTYPYPFNEGIFIPSMAETQISLRQVVIEREDKPYGNCTDDIYIKRYGFKYTRSLCQTLCSQEKFKTACGCYEDEATEIFYQIKNTNLKFCESESEVKCMLKERARQDKNKAECQCFNPCKEYQYMKTISSRNWPTENYMDTLREGVCDRIPNKCDSAYSDYNQPELFKKGLNYVKINIFYEDLNYEEIKETPEIETAQFASDFGGAIGLWIGLSFLSMFEVVQLLLECCAYAVHKCGKRSNSRNKRRKRNRQRRYNGRQNVYTTEKENYIIYNLNSKRNYTDIVSPDNSSGPYMYDTIDENI